jgi:phthalate 4,5-dioxygenase reductase subunit
VIAIPVGASILETLRARGYDLRSSCESGTCGTCRTKLLAGEADHRDFVLHDGERATSIMICVSRARSDELVLDL